MCRLTAAHKTIRLMLLGPPPDMVHGALLHRTRTPIFRNGSDSRAFVQLHTLRRDNFYYTTQQTEFQVFLQKNFIFSVSFFCIFSSSNFLSARFLSCSSNFLFSISSYCLQIESSSIFFLIPNNFNFNIFFNHHHQA